MNTLMMMIVECSSFGEYGLERIFSRGSMILCDNNTCSIFPVHSPLLSATISPVINLHNMPGKISSSFHMSNSVFRLHFTPAFAAFLSSNFCFFLFFFDCFMPSPSSFCVHCKSHNLDNKPTTPSTHSENISKALIRYSHLTSISSF